MDSCSPDYMDFSSKDMNGYIIYIKQKNYFMDFIRINNKIKLLSSTGVSFAKSNNKRS